MFAAEDAGSAANHQADATEPVLNGTDAGVMNGTEDGGASNGMDEVRNSATGLLALLSAVRFTCALVKAVTLDLFASPAGLSAVCPQLNAVACLCRSNWCRLASGPR